MQAVQDREIGAYRKRVEDPRLVRGEGQYVDDLRLPGTLEVVFVRSDYAHAKIKSVDLSAARPRPAWLRSGTASTSRTSTRITNTIAIEGRERLAAAAAGARQGDPAGYAVAAVVAESKYQARDAAALVEIDYEPLPVVTKPEAAMLPDAPMLWPEFGTNVAYHFVKEGGDVDGVFASAEHTLSLRWSTVGWRRCRWSRGASSPATTRRTTS